MAAAPRAFEAQFLLAAQDDPAALADHAVARAFDADAAAREIDAALAADDPDLAMSFLDLARERNLPIDPALAEKVERANAGIATAARTLESFARGLIVGEAADISGLAGTAVGDLFVLGDVRDALREGTRLAVGRDGDELVLGLACVGLAVTAGTYATVGAAVPARAGLTVVKTARKTGRLGAPMAAWIDRSLREVVDWTALKRAVNGASIAEPAADLEAIAADIAYLGIAFGSAYELAEVGNAQSAMPAAMRQASGRIVRGLERYDFDLDQHVARQARHLDGRARGRSAAEILGPAIDLVHRGKVVHALQKHRRLHHIHQIKSRFSKHGLDVLKHANRLFLDAAGNKLSRRGINRNLSRGKQRIANPHSL